MLHTLEINTKRREEMIDITRQVREAIGASGKQDGVALVFIPHTTCAVTINENADPDVQHDILRYLKSRIPKEDGFRHFEGNSDAHIKTLLTGNSVQVIFNGGEPVLGTWQGIYFCEYDGPRSRKCHVKIL